MAVRIDLASILVGVWSVERAIRAELKEGAVVFSDMAFSTLFLKILDDDDTGRGSAAEADNDAGEFFISASGSVLDSEVIAFISKVGGGGRAVIGLNDYNLSFLYGIFPTI